MDSASIAYYTRVAVPLPAHRLPSYDLRFDKIPLGLSPCWMDVNPGISRMVPVGR